MRTEGFEAGRNIASEAFVAQGALNQIEEPCVVPSEEVMPQNSAIRGLVIAASLSLVLWAGIGALIWKLVHH